MCGTKQRVDLWSERHVEEMDYQERLLTFRYQYRELYIYGIYIYPMNASLPTSLAPGLSI